MVTVQSWLQAVDGVAIKPRDTDLTDIVDLPVDSIVVDFEGRAAMPDVDTLARAAQTTTIRATIPVRGDGFDPLGDDTRLRTLPESVERVYVAGHPEYLSRSERHRSVAPRLVAAADRTPTAWVGTENVERTAIATDLTQFELLGPTTEREVLSLRAAGVTAEWAVYAPIAPTEDDDRLLDALGDYAARRPRVRPRLEDGCPTDSRATGRHRDRLLTGIDHVALVGSAESIAHRIDRLRSVGIDRVIGYPALGIEGGPGA